ncbi:MAG TPA: hypothetical protein VN175_04930 [Rhizomicrobium sp.]|nr:hypothetical protein [Rhizomicrobium sp.]
MHHLGSRTGTGILFDRSGHELGAAAFSLDVFEHRGLRDGKGTLTASAETLAKVFGKDGVRLQYGEGLEFRLVVDHMGSGAATFKTSGPIPGF